MNGCWKSARRDDLDVLIDLGGYNRRWHRLKFCETVGSRAGKFFLGYRAHSSIPGRWISLNRSVADPSGLNGSPVRGAVGVARSCDLACGLTRVSQGIFGCRHDRPTLGAFNNVAKVSPRDDLRPNAEIMRPVPERLVLKYGDRFGVATLRNPLSSRVCCTGVCCRSVAVFARRDGIFGLSNLRTMAMWIWHSIRFRTKGTMTSLECLWCGHGRSFHNCGDLLRFTRATSAYDDADGVQELSWRTTETSTFEIASSCCTSRPFALRYVKKFGIASLKSALTDTVGFGEGVWSRFLRAGSG